MDIKVIGSGSSGNAYLVNDGHTKILLDCGITFKRIQVACDYETSNIEAVLITHEHGDHCKSVKDFIKRGIKIIATKGTLDELNISAPAVEYLEVYNVGSFKIMPFEIKHDCKEPCGFLILSTITNEKLLYLTDSAYCEYRFEGLTDILIECNHDRQIIIKQIIENGLNQTHCKRVLENHMSLDTCVDFLLSNDLSKIKEINLIHLSERNSDATFFKKRVQQATGKIVNIY